MTRIKNTKWRPATTKKNGATPKSQKTREIKFNKMKKSVLLSLLTILFCGLLSNSIYAQYDKMLIGDNNNGQIVSSNINGTALDTLNLPINQSFYDADVDQVNQKIFFAHYWGIFKMNYDGSAFDTLVYEPTGSYSDGIAVDAAAGYLYWAAMQEKKIYRSDLNGTNITTLYNATGFVTDIDLDLINNKIYFGQWFSSARGLFSVDLSGNNLDTIITAGYDVHFIGLDLSNSKIYFSDDALAKCRRINYDGTNDTLLYNFQAGGFFVDTTNSLLYTSNMINNNIVLSDLNGGSPSNIFPTSTLASPHGPLLFSTLTTGIENILESSNQTTIYPNPFSATTILHTDNILKNATLTVYNSYGQKIKQLNQLFGETIILQRDNLPSGVYFIQLSQDNKLISTEKMVITD
jgi:hypothetical protein